MDGEELKDVIQTALAVIFCWHTDLENINSVGDLEYFPLSISVEIDAAVVETHKLVNHTKLAWHELAQNIRTDRYRHPQSGSEKNAGCVFTYNIHSRNVSK